MRRNIKLNILSFIDSHLVNYGTPVNINYFWSFGSLAGIVLVCQIITGIFLAMHYIPHIDMAFDSIEHIMRDVQHGWFFRYAHANGASMFFIAVYLHIFRGFYYCSYSSPRKAIWSSGIVIFLLMMATAFMGYVLPWGQMSFWGVTVITSLATVIPYAGESIVEWFWGGFSINEATLTRFFSLHYCLPFVICGMVLVHLALLHEEGSSNPLGIKSKMYSVPFYPYYYVKDLFAFSVFFLLFAYFVFFNPNFLGHPDNYIMANSISTPAHIVPEWYFLPFYAILRSIPHKTGGILAMLGSLLIWFSVLFITHAENRGATFRLVYSWIFWILVITFVNLGWIGQMPVNEPWTEIGLFWTILYFISFLTLPFVEKIAKTLDE